MSILPFFYDAAFGRSHGSEPLKDGRTSPDAQPMPAQEKTNRAPIDACVFTSNYHRSFSTKPATDVLEIN
jgi:hypothetical protein